MAGRPENGSARSDQFSVRFWAMRPFGAGGGAAGATGGAATGAGATAAGSVPVASRTAASRVVIGAGAAGFGRLFDGRRRHDRLEDALLRRNERVRAGEQC